MYSKREKGQYIEDEFDYDIKVGSNQAAEQGETAEGARILEDFGWLKNVSIYASILSLN